MMSLPHFLPNLLLLLWLIMASAVQPTIKNLVQSGETIVLESPDFPNPYTMLPSPKIWQIRWALQTPAHLQILFSDLRLHPNSRLELYDGDLPAFRLTPTARLLVRYESGADYWRRIAFTAESGALTVVFTPLAEPNKHSNAFSWMDSQSEVRSATPNQPIPGNIDYEGFRIEIKLLYYASSAWLERPWSNCGWLQYTADSVSLLGTVWRHFDCVWVLRPPAGTKAWLRLRAHKLVKDSYRYDIEVHDGGTSAAARLAKLTSGTSAWQPEQVFVSKRPLYVRIRGNFSDSANHLVLQYHFFSIAAATAGAASPADCSKISPGFESCDKLHLCVLPVCYKLPELSACGPGLNCSLGPPGLRSCLLRLDSHDGQRGAGLRPRTLCDDGLRCVPLSVACPAEPSELLPPLTNWKRPLNPWPPAAASGLENHPEDSESEDSDRADDRSSSSSSLNVLASLGGVCLAAVALIGLGFAALTVRSRRQRRRLQFQQRRHQRQPVDSHSASSLMRVFRLAGANGRRLQQSNNLSAARAEGEDECLAHHHQLPPPPTPPPAYSEVFGRRRPRTGQSPPEPPSTVVASSATAAAAAASATGGGGGGEPSCQQTGHQRHRHSRHRQEPQVEPQSAARGSAALLNPTEATQPSAQLEQPQDRPIQFEQPHTVRLPPLHGAC